MALGAAVVTGCAGSMKVGTEVGAHVFIFFDFRYRTGIITGVDNCVRQEASVELTRYATASTASVVGAHASTLALAKKRRFRYLIRSIPCQQMAVVLSKFLTISGRVRGLKDGRVAVRLTDNPSGRVSLKFASATGSMLRSVIDILRLRFPAKIPRLLFGYTLALSKNCGQYWQDDSGMLAKVKKRRYRKPETSHICRMKGLDIYVAAWKR
jgi:hypothetical protein